VETEQTFEKAARIDTTARRIGSIESIQNISCFLLHIIHKLDIIRKECVICL